MGANDVSAVRERGIEPRCLAALEPKSSIPQLLESTRPGLITPNRQGPVKLCLPGNGIPTPSSSWLVEAGLVTPLVRRPSAYKRKARLPRPCLLCGKAFVGPAQRLYCGSRCYRLASRKTRKAYDDAAPGYDKGRYARLRAAGQCVRCGLASGGEARCSSCRRRLAELRAP
jgi:hypothetical protein